MSPYLIGIMGKAGCGKTSLASAFAEMDFRCANFADALKDFCASEFGYDRKRLDEWDYKEEVDPNLPGWTRRRILQYFGT